MEKHTYKTSGVCSRLIEFETAPDGTVHNVSYVGGCNGNLQGIGRLVEGMDKDEIIRRLKGVDCRGKGTSCPDQLARALESMDK